MAAAFGPAALLTLERFAPSHVGKGGFAPAMRLVTAIGLTGGFLYFYQRSARTSTDTLAIFLSLFFSFALTWFLASKMDIQADMGI